jgi:hypothetical protein
MTRVRVYVVWIGILACCAGVWAGIAWIVMKVI